MGRGTRDKGRKEREGGVSFEACCCGWPTGWLLGLLSCWVIARVCKGRKG